MISRTHEDCMQAAKKCGVWLGRPRSLETGEQRQVIRQWRSTVHRNPHSRISYGACKSKPYGGPLCGDSTDSGRRRKKLRLEGYPVRIIPGQVS